MSWDAIRYFDGLGETRTTRNRLPHWDQPGATCFLTFRLADSLPQDLIRQFKEERQTWLTRNPEPWDEKTEAEYHRLFSTKIDKWLDAAHGECLLRQPALAKIVSSSFHHFDSDRYLLHSFVVMPNHVHLMFTLSEKHTLSGLVHSWKLHSSREINKARGTSGVIWQRDYFDRIVRDLKHFLRIVRYIRKNVGQYPPATHYESEWIRGLQ